MGNAPTGTEISDYLATLPSEERERILEIYARAREVVPETVEGLSYGMPTLMYKGKGLIAVMSTKKTHRRVPLRKSRRARRGRHRGWARQHKGIDPPQKGTNIAHRVARPLFAAPGHPDRRVAQHPTGGVGLQVEVIRTGKLARPDGAPWPLTG